MEEPTFDNEEKYFEEGNIENRKKRLNEKMIEWSQKGDIHHLNKYLNDEMTDLNIEDSNGWTCLIWSVVNEKEEVLRILLDYNLNRKIKEKNERIGVNDSMYGNSVASMNSGELNNLNESQNEDDNPDKPISKPKQNQEAVTIDEKNIEDAFKKITHQKNNKYSPLHWSAYKGNILITSLLLKNKYNPLEVDMYGNNSIHQAAASNNKTLFKLFMGLGYDLEHKNARGHTAFDLTTNDEIKGIIKMTNEKKKCDLCQKQFSFYITKYLCYVNEEVTCKDCCISKYYYQSSSSIKKEIVENRCVVCSKEIDCKEKELREAIENNNLNEIIRVYDSCKQMKLNPKLKVQVESSVLRLEAEKRISDLILSLNNVKDHKTIEKSVFLLENEADQAKQKGILLDNDIVEKCLLQKNKKLAERDLRRVLNNMTIFDSSNILKEEIEAKLKIAIETNVDEEFVKIGLDFLEKIKLNLECNEIYQNLVSYPPREYKPIEDNSKKKKKPEPVKKKKKKKELPFAYPQWAIAVKEKDKQSEIIKQVLDKYLLLIKQGELIGLKEEFCIKAKEIQTRFNLEIAFLKKEEEEKRLLEEERLKKMKKNKKK